MSFNSSSLSFDRDVLQGLRQTVVTECVSCYVLNRTLGEAAASVVITWLTRHGDCDVCPLCNCLVERGDLYREGGRLMCEMCQEEEREAALEDAMAAEEFEEELE